MGDHGEDLEGGLGIVFDGGGGEEFGKHLETGRDGTLGEEAVGGGAAGGGGFGGVGLGEGGG